ncbi:MAG: hypothetical protein C0600_12515 [Ignavibacteria bacterium]|nr:MAG: hypothetical protein C0600_12515 [Ignavibacteria bacterium]
MEYLEDDEEYDDDDDEDEDEDEDPKDIPEAEQEKIVAQFADAEHNAEVERTAVDLVTKSFESEGWSVVSREQDRCGYDLHCTREDAEYHVEVKGTSGEDVRFIMTEKEFSTAMDDDDYLVCVVTEALSEEPVITMYDADDLLEEFRYQPLRWAFMLDED